MIEHGQKAQVVKDQHGHRYVMVHGANYNSRGGQANYLGNNHYVQAPMAEYSQDKYAPSHDNYGQSQDNYAPSQEKYGHEEYSLIPDNGEMEITYDHHDPYPQWFQSRRRFMLVTSRNKNCFTMYIFLFTLLLFWLQVLFSECFDVFAFNAFNSSKNLDFAGKIAFGMPIGCNKTLDLVQDLEAALKLRQTDEV